MNSDPGFLQEHRNQRSIYAHLVAGFRDSVGQAVEERWSWLMAAHVIGQASFSLHVHSHVLMLRFSISNRDWHEVVGQSFRLALVPLGHALGRLPTGNIGRATVSAFQPMTLSPEMRRLIAQARMFGGKNNVDRAPNTLA